MKKLIILSLVLVLFVVPVMALGTQTAPNITPAEIITRVINLIWTAILLFAALMIILAAIMFLTGGGNDDQLKKAKSYLLYAIIGIAVGASAKGLAAFIVSSLGA